jgi:hypothetical protein
MRKSIVSSVALSALLAGGVLIASAQAQNVGVGANVGIGVGTPGVSGGRRNPFNQLDPEVVMSKSAIASLALPALVAGSLLAAPAHAQFGAPAAGTTTITTFTTNGTPVGNPNMAVPPAPATTITTTTTTPATNGPGMAMPAGGIGSGMQGGVGAPIGGLDSNPYAEAPQAARALGYPYHPPGKSGSSSLN